MKLCPCLVHGCTALPVTASVGDCAGVQNKEEGNVHILRFHVWLRASIGVSNSILYFFEKCFNWVLKVDWRSHLAVIFCELSRIDESISLFKMH
jgi:hypothetical protein